MKKPWQRNENPKIYPKRPNLPESPPLRIGKPPSFQTAADVKREGLQTVGFKVGEMHITPKRVKGPDGRWTWKNPESVKSLVETANRLRSENSKTPSDQSDTPTKPTP